MGAVKVSVSLPDSLAKFVETYRKKSGLKRSQVFEEAIKLLRRQELEAAYREAVRETDKEWEVVASDGLADEAW